MKLRVKILSGFLVLAIMLAIAGAWSVYELDFVGSSVQNILDENYRSIHSAKQMNEALEREDSAILLLLLGNWEKGRSLLDESDSLFTLNYQILVSNITINGEKELLDTIKLEYINYKKAWARPVVDTKHQGNLNWYLANLHKPFTALKLKIDRLISLNDKSMFKTASELKSRSKRAVMPGIVAIVSALIFTLIFVYFVNYFMVSPIIRITSRIKEFKEKRRPFVVNIESKDEINDLAKEITLLCQSVSDENVK